MTIEMPYVVNVKVEVERLAENGGIEVDVYEHTGGLAYVLGILYILPLEDPTGDPLAVYGASEYDGVSWTETLSDGTVAN